MNKKRSYTLLFILVVVALYFAEKYIDRENEHYPQTTSGDTSFSSTEFSEDLLPTSTTGTVVSHSSYTLSYAEEHEQAEWVAYPMLKEQLSNNDFKRPYFIQDRDVKSGSADWRNYKNSGYDRGHLCPAGDRRYNYDAYHETFLTSNISPQNHDFNAGIWNRLEQKVRYWADSKDGVFVFTGGVLKERLKTIGDERVSVPEEFFKIVVDASGGNYKAIAFLIPNEPSSASFYDFATTIDTIEEKTGIDFFPKLTASEEKQLESQVNLKSWGKR